MENENLKEVEKIATSSVQVLYGPPTESQENQPQIKKEIGFFSIIVLCILGFIAFITKKIPKKIKLIIIPILLLLIAFCIIFIIYF